MKRYGPQLIWFLSVMALLLLGSGCAAEIGDSCSINLDCSPNGDRICDTSQRGGYCTVQGCSATSCPEESVCIAFYPVSMLSTPCDPQTEDAVDPALNATDDCDAHEICLSSGFCAQHVQESRFCMRSCSENDDCRDGYECRSPGSGGSEAIYDPEKPDAKISAFCVERLN